MHREHKLSTDKPTTFEREIKIDVNDAVLRDKLVPQNYYRLFSLVIDTYFDTNRMEMLETDEVLRVRQIDNSYYLSYKGKREIDIDNIVSRTEHKLSVENEIIYSIIQRFFIIRDIVEKKRALIHDKLFPKLIIYYDNYPFIGNYIEVEGDPTEIKKYIKYYQIPLSSLERRNCTEIFIEFCKANGIYFNNIRCAFKFKNESGAFL